LREDGYVDVNDWADKEAMTHRWEDSEEYFMGDESED
jgi:hypothetical protein